MSNEENIYEKEYKIIKKKDGSYAIDGGLDYSEKKQVQNKSVGDQVMNYFSAGHGTLWDKILAKKDVPKYAKNIIKGKFHSIFWGYGYLNDFAINKESSNQAFWSSSAGYVASYGSTAVVTTLLGPIAGTTFAMTVAPGISTFFNDSVDALFFGDSQKRQNLNNFYKEANELVKDAFGFIKNKPEIKASQGHKNNNLREQVNPNADNPSVSNDQGNLALKGVLNDVLTNSHEDIIDATSFLGEKAGELFFKDNTLQESLSVSGKIMSSGVKNGTVLDGVSFYDHPEINTDPTQRIQNSGGIATGETAGISDSENVTSNLEMPAASDPASKMNTKLKTPNMESIKNALYGQAKKYATSYLRNRGRELVFGKKLTKKLQKVDKARGYYNTTKALAKRYASNHWNAASNAIKSAANAVWNSVAQTTFGHALSSAAAWVGTQLTALWGGLTGLPVIGAAIAAIGSAVATVAGWALTALAFLAW